MNVDTTPLYAPPGGQSDARMLSGRPAGQGAETALPLAELAALIQSSPNPSAVPHACDIAAGIPLYEGATLRAAFRDESLRPVLYRELAGVLAEGAGIVIVRSAWNHEVLDAATEAFHQIIQNEARSGDQAGDHFGQAGANARIWNALQKLCAHDAAAYVRYYASEILDGMAQSWLGPGYRLTSQVNVVRPGGQGQTPHCDYHLGFMSGERMARFPAHVHRMSPYLTLQAAVAHVDMPRESGPTLFLPYSQRLDFQRPGSSYRISLMPEFPEFFAQHHVQLPLNKGDAVFFNPAVIHAAGKNTTSTVNRMANLLQISSPFGVPMEAIDAKKMVGAIYPELLRLQREGAIDAAALQAVVAATAEGYAFPTNLDQDPPVGGLSPDTQQDYLRRALSECWPPERLAQVLQALSERRQPS